MTTAPNYLLDADAIICCYELDAWEHVVAGADVAVCGTIVRDEARFTRDEDGQLRQVIHLPALVSQGKIRELSVSETQLEALVSMFDASFAEGLDPGEAESLAYVLSGAEPARRFCTGDKKALWALAMVDKASSAIALYDLLRQCGITKKLPHNFESPYMKHHLRIGFEKRMTGEGMSTGP